MSSSSPSLALHRPRKSPWPAIPMEEAWSILDDQFGQYLGQLRSVEEKNTNQLDLLGHVLAESLHSFRPVPSFRASIKDGYAVIAADGPGPHRMVAISTAGQGKGKGKKEIGDTDKCAKAECVRISTGAKVPEWADAVVQVEETTVLEDDGHEELSVDIGENARKGQNIREIGSDVEEGELLLEKGTMLGAAEIGLVALSGKNKLLVYGRPKVSVISTGDELMDFFGTKSENEDPIDAVMDTNRPLLLGLLRQNGFEEIDGGIAEDGRSALVGAIESAFGEADLVVLTGGVSMGEKDLLKDILVTHFHFNIHFGRVFMKPGLPTTFASGQGPDGRRKFVFGLPGNPVSAFVTAHLFLLPQLRRIAGLDSEWQNARLAVQLLHPIPQLDPRPEYRRALLLRPPNGHSPSSPPFAQCILGSQISSRLLSTRSANLLLELPANNAQKGALEEGETVTALVIGPI